jgi:Concanavalin A-like lectin/glucanases superfamily
MMKAIILLLVLGSWSCCLADSPESGLLFYLSGDHEFTADYAAGGDPKPNFLRDVKIIPDGAKGAGFECANTQLMSYWAPGNIYAERGTLSFSWRSRYPVGPTAFPIFRVGYADHSSWDMVWLRIDYNGRGGFDAFVTDINLARIRVSYVMPKFPAPNEWVHLALTWDETVGIRLYVNGRMAARQDKQAVLYSGLDQFGPHSRTIGPMQVQSDYNYIRGGDIDEIRIYDRMLSSDNVASLAKGIAPRKLPDLERSLGERKWLDEWWLRYGWNRPGDVPAYLDSARTSVRKVEIHDVYDLKRWWWKATDGIRETTWPGVYNRSRLPGRNDYFQLPDWDCYSLSGKSVTFTMPDEPWNHLEISGAAWGKMYLDGTNEQLLFQRPKDQEKTFHRLATAISGEKIRFENVEQEEPIGELSAYYVTAGSEPPGSRQLSYSLPIGPEAPDGALTSDDSVTSIKTFINGRYTADERATIVAIPDTTADKNPQSAIRNPHSSLPLVHIIIPAGDWQSLADGLDGIAIDLPALQVKTTHGQYFPLNIQVKDPLWPQRNLLDFSFSVKPEEPRTLWLDTRDRILPAGKALYLTIAGAGKDFGPASLKGAKVRLIFKPRAEAAKEHEIDRFTQAIDAYAMLIEEHTNNPRLNLYNRFAADITDLLRVNPNHWLGQTYWYDSNRSHPKPAFTQPAAPEGVPLWAFRQTEQLRNLNRFVLWYIDNRQIENGEFGGGLSDDNDLTNIWPPTALMGCEPEKIKSSLMREMDAFYNEGMFTNGLPTIQADELHSYEEGIEALGESLLLDYGDPKQLERAMETERSVIKLTGINAAGHRHFRTSYYNGLKMATEEPWGWSKPSSTLVLHPGILLVNYNGNPTMKKVITELADGFLAHRQNGRVRTNIAIRFSDDQEAPNNRGSVLPIFWAAWKWTGDAKYLEPFRDLGPRALEAIPANALDQLDARPTWGNEIATLMRSGSGIPRPNAPNPNSQRLNVPPPPNSAAMHLAWQMTGDKHFLESLYASQIETSAFHQFMNTDGSMWIDRVDVANAELQRARLGGVAMVRGSLYPGNAVSWTFQTAGDEEKTAILIPNATPQSLKIIVYNLGSMPVTAAMTGWDLDPGQWEITQGLDRDGDDSADGVTMKSIVELERTGWVNLTFPPGVTSVVDLRLVAKGIPYWARPDLGISAADVKLHGRTITVTVHSLGAVETSPTTLTLVTENGTLLSSASVPRLEAPIDLVPRTVTVTMPLPARKLSGCSLLLDPELKMKEITRVNNQVKLDVFNH